MPEITQTVTGSVGLDPATTSWVLPLALWAGGVRRREKRRKLTGRRSCPDGNPQFLPLNPEGLLEKGALGELGRGGIPRHRGGHPFWWVLRYSWSRWMAGMQVWVRYRTLGSATGLMLGRLFGMCPLPSRTTFGLTCCLYSSSSPSTLLGSLSQCQEIVGQR